MILLILFCHVISALSSSSYPWLVALWCLSANRASFRPLPLAHSFFFLLSGILQLWIPSFFSLFSSEITTILYLFARVLVSSSLSLSTLFPSRVTLSEGHAILKVLPFSSSPVLPRSCVAVWVMQVIMVNRCAISMETSVWSGTSSAHQICLLCMLRY